MHDVARLGAVVAAVGAVACNGDDASTWTWNGPDASMDASVDAPPPDSDTDAADAPAESPPTTDADAPETDPGSWVTVAEPADGTTVPNPVLFRVDAHGVDEVELFADQTWSLGAAWDPSQRDTLLVRFSGTGVPRPIRLVGRSGGSDVAQDDITITVEPDSCEDRFFVTQFDTRNEDATGTIDLIGLREEALAALKSAVGDMQACGAGVTLGGMMSLLLYEGGFRLAAYNTRCEENSYNPTPTDCDADPEALYSYQFGLGAIHTSNFHPCKGGSYTQAMRQAFLDEAASAGFDVDASLMTASLESRFQQVCPGSESSVVDYYLLGAHDVFGIPRDGTGNYLEGFGAFPLFSPGVSIRLSFRELLNGCASIGDDGDAIAVFGGGDTSYTNPSKQAEILSYFNDWAAANCP